MIHFDRPYFLRYQLPVFLWAGLIFAVSSYPHLPTPETSFRHLDKIAHFFEYGVLGYLMTRSFFNHGRASVSRKAIPLALLLGLVLAGTDEFYQLFVPGRMASLGDFFADGTGVLVALGIFYRRHIRKDRGAREKV